jgi:CheY-like chemotaxis protein
MPTVLVVEDHPGYRRALSLFLGGKGYDVCCAADGAEALRLLRENRQIGLVILDLVMPEFDAADVVAAIRSDGELRGLPVLIATAAAAPRLEAVMRRDVQAWLIKSNVTLAELLRRIEQHLPSPPDQVPRSSSGT